MKKFATLLLFFSVLMVATSCSNDDDSSNSNPNPTNGFTWTDSADTSTQTVDTPYASAQFFSVFAVQQGATIYEINLTSLAVGSYSLASASGNSLYYNKTGNLPTGFSPSSGTVTITANANNKLSGTFSATGSGGGVTTVTGQFTNITINP
jgi:hypothetical protein